MVLWSELGNKTHSSIDPMQEQPLHPFLIPTAKQTPHPPVMHQMPTNPPRTLNRLCVHYQPNQKTLLLPLPPSSTCLSPEVR